MKYKELVDKLIKISFPKLKNRKPKIFVFKIFKGYASYFPIVNIIVINKKWDKFSNKERVGLLVHELSHAEQSSKMGFLENIFLFVKYWLSKKTRKKIEIEADKITIKKDYAKELFEMTKTYEKEFGKIRYGLTQSQVKSHAKKIRKW